MPGIGHDADTWWKIWYIHGNEKRNTYMQHYGSGTPFYICRCFVFFLQKSQQRLYPSLLPFACLFFHSRSLQWACTSVVLPLQRLHRKAKHRALNYSTLKGVCVPSRKTTPASCAWASPQNNRDLSLKSKRHKLTTSALTCASGTPKIQQKKKMPQKKDKKLLQETCWIEVILNIPKTRQAGLQSRVKKKKCRSEHLTSILSARSSVCIPVGVWTTESWPEGVRSSTHTPLYISGAVSWHWRTSRRTPHLTALTPSMLWREVVWSSPGIISAHHSHHVKNRGETRNNKLTFSELEIKLTSSCTGNPTNTNDCNLFFFFFLSCWFRLSPSAGTNTE